MTNGLTDEAIAAYGAELLDLEAEIEVKQGDKKAIYANLREAYGKRAADSLKLAIKRHRMDADKRTEADEIDAEAERFLTIIRKPSAPRATRTREIIEEFDPETGEIKPQAEPVQTGGVRTADLPSNAGTEAVEAPAFIQAETPNDIGSDERAVTGIGPESTANAGRSVPEDARDVASTAIPHPVEGTTPTSAADDDRGAVSSLAAAPVVPSNVTTFRTHNPETHFLNSEGLPRLHGCQKGEMCGSAEPRKRLCFPCSVAHDGPTPQVEGGAA